MCIRDSNIAAWTSNPQKFEDRKEAAHTTFLPYPSTEQLRACLLYTSRENNKYNFYNK